MTRSKRRVWVSRPTFDTEVERLAAHCEVAAEREDAVFAPIALAAKLAGCDAAIVGGKDRIDAAAIVGATRLRIVASLSVGHDNLDLAALSAAGIAATNAAGALDDSVADFAFALLLSAARRVGEAERWLRAGHWQRNGFRDWLGVDVRGRTLGIYGMGRIGRAIAHRALGFDMPVLYHNRTRVPDVVERQCRARYVDAATLLRESDFLVVALPLTTVTHHLFDADALAQMRSGAVLVNVGRGGVVDDAALAGALRDGRLAGAGLDVFEGEPRLCPELLRLDNVVLTPHIASATGATRRAMTAAAVDNVLAAFGFGPHAGHPPNLLNPEVLAAPGAVLSPQPLRKP